MSDVDQEKEMVIQCAESMVRVGFLIENAAALDLHPSLDWEQLLRYVNEQMLLGCENSMFSDPAKQMEALNKVIVGIAARKHGDLRTVGFTTRQLNMIVDALNAIVWDSTEEGANEWKNLYDLIWDIKEGKTP